jgi:hypothetical protein
MYVLKRIFNKNMFSSTVPLKYKVLENRKYILSHGIDISPWFHTQYLKLLNNERLLYRNIMRQFFIRCACVASARLIFTNIYL